MCMDGSDLSKPFASFHAFHEMSRPLPPKFLLVYTKDLRKKHKNWVDGFGRLFHNGKLCLYSSDDRLIDSQFISWEALDSPDPIKLDYHLAEVDTPLQFVGPSGSVPQVEPQRKPAPAPPSRKRSTPEPPDIPPPDQLSPDMAALDRIRSANEI